MLVLRSTTVALVVRKNGVGNAAVRDNLNRTTVVVELLLCDDVRVVTMYAAVHADDALYYAGYCADVVRYHHDRHPSVELVQ